VSGRRHIADKADTLDLFERTCLLTGDKFAVTHIPAGEYHFRFVDADGDVCDLSTHI
jgi:hypothetical protein